MQFAEVDSQQFSKQNAELNNTFVVNLVNGGLKVGKSVSVAVLIIAS